jgi:hypothetical protein
MSLRHHIYKQLHTQPSISFTLQLLPAVKQKGHIYLGQFTLLSTYHSLCLAVSHIYGVFLARKAFAFLSTTRGVGILFACQ